MYDQIKIGEKITWVVYDPKQNNVQDEPIEEPAIGDDDTKPRTITSDPIISKPENQMVLKPSRFSRVNIDWQLVSIVAVTVITAVVQVLGVILGALASGIAEAASHSCLFSKWE